jgi:hypothetical protein
MVIVRQFVEPNNGILAGGNPELDTTNTDNDSQRKKGAEEGIFHRKPKVHDLLEMWQGCEDIRAPQKESHTNNMPMSAVRYVSDTDDIIKASWLLFQHDGVGAYKLSE